MIYISSSYVKGKIESEALDLNNLPAFPIMHPKHIGYIDYYNERTCSGSIITNGYGIDILKAGKSIDIRFCLKDIRGNVKPSKGQLVTFYINDYNSSQLKAIDIDSLQINLSDFNLIKQYTGTFSQIHGRNYNGRVYTKAILEDCLFMYLNNEEGISIILNELTEEKTFPEWMPQENPHLLQILFKIIDTHSPNDEIYSFVSNIRKNNVANAIKLMSEEDKLPFIRHLSDDFAIEIMTVFFYESDLYNSYIEEKWDSIKAEMPYVVFDLESDGRDIKEFSFIKEDNSRTYQSEEQLLTLGRALKHTPIIVGHNIRQWDLPILEKKGISTESFIWDTLIIEILLNPCRYAYSLHTTHKAEEDVKLTDSLFWNQLYRFSIQPDLCKSLEIFLPQELNSILDKLQKPIFKEYFQKKATQQSNFFQTLRPLSEQLKNQLSAISQIPESERVLIVAPKDLWPRISQEVKMQFPNCSDPEYKVVNKEIVIDKLQDNLLAQNVLLRFCETSKTPIVANIPQYLRIENENPTKVAFSDEFLLDYLKDSESHIDCIDIGSFEDSVITTTEYRHIFVIGLELHDRIHKCCVGTWSFADLMARGCKLPFAMAATNCAVVKDDDLIKLGIPKPKLAANFWAERNQDKSFSIYQNFQYQAYKDLFYSHFNVKPKYIDWMLEGQTTNNISITQVGREKKENAELRVSVSSTQRSKYWLFQFEILKEVHKTCPDKPIVYIVSNLDEIDELNKYATSLDFFVPQNGTGFRKLEYIGSDPNGMVIISKDQFVNEIGSYRTDKAFCYVWDNMDIDRYMLMWDKLPFENDIEDDADDEKDDKVYRTTPKQCIYASWPIFEHYCSLMKANSEESQLFIIDSHFDDYSDLAKECNAKWLKVSLWKNKDDYEKAFVVAKKHFKDIHGEDINMETAEAMDYIRKYYCPLNYDYLAHVCA